jgi:TolB-like protein/Flp pilus assembly protein TadD
VSLFAELRRRNVFRVAAAYVVIGWLVLQIAGTVIELIGAPPWLGKALIALLLLGFLPAVALAWAFEVGPEGIRRDDGSARGEHSRRGRRLEIVTLAALALAIGLLVWQQLGPVGQPRDATRPQELAAEAPAAAEMRGAAPNSIAVLPFANRSAEPESVHFVDGVHDDLITQLAKISALRVISRTSVQEYRNTSKKIPQIAAELNVASVLEGAVQRSGDRLRITAQLIRASDDTHLWAENFDRKLTAENLFEVQTEIARNIAHALEATLSPKEAARVGHVPTHDLAALEAYRQALALIWRGEAGDREVAERNLDLALARDPGFAAAHAARARLEISRYWYGDAGPTVLQRARAALDAARAIDPDFLELHVAEGYLYYWGHRDYANALVSVQRAVEFAPGDSETLALKGFVLRRMGRFEESAAALAAAHAGDPRNTVILLDWAHLRLRAGQVAEARSLLERAKAVYPDNPFVADIQATLVLETEGDLATARALLAGTVPLDISSAWLRWWVPMAEGRADEALAASDLGEFARSAAETTYFDAAVLRGLVYYRQGDREAARREFAAARARLETELHGNERDSRLLKTLCVTLGGLGELAAAQATCADADRLAIPDAYAVEEYMLALGLTLAGDSDGALALLERLFAKPAGWYILRLDLDPLFAPLHDDPRFVAMMARYREFLQL